MQASSTSGVSSNVPATVVSPSDSGTEAAKAHHPSNEGVGADATSSSSPRSTLAAGAVFAGEPMPISDTQFLAPRVCCNLRHTPLLVPLCMSSTYVHHAMLEPPMCLVQ